MPPSSGKRDDASRRVFFFQAEDGIRDLTVTGVQTCALPISDQSLYPSDSVPALLRRINNALKRADEIAHLKDDHSIYWFAPLVADAEAGFGGPLHAFEIMKNMIDAGAAGGDFWDPAPSGEKSGPPRRKGPLPPPEVLPQPGGARRGAE